jgi:hypothetical protein
MRTCFAWLARAFHPASWDGDCDADAEFNGTCIVPTSLSALIVEQVKDPCDPKYPKITVAIL